MFMIVAKHSPLLLFSLLSCFPVARKLVFLLILEVSTRNDMGDMLKFELRYVDREIINTLKVCFILRHY